MSNVIAVPHTVSFMATIDLDKIEARLLPTLLALSEEELINMCTQATLAALDTAKLLEVANTGFSWAELSITK